MFNGDDEIEVGQNIKVFTVLNDAMVDDVSGRCMTGAWIWESSLLLAEWLVKATETAELQLEGKRVIELGAGCTGLPGLTAALLGAEEVVLTDRSPLVPALHASIVANGLTGRARAQTLEWGPDIGADADMNRAPFDMLLMSDLLYDVDQVALLCQTISQLSGPETLVLHSYEPRLVTDECLAVFHDHGLTFCDLPRHALPARWQGENNASILTIWEVEPPEHTIPAATANCCRSCDGLK